MKLNSVKVAKSKGKKDYLLRISIRFHGLMSLASSCAEHCNCVNYVKGIAENIEFFNLK